jgi:hypothetical protein
MAAIIGVQCRAVPVQNSSSRISPLRPSIAPQRNNPKSACIEPWLLQGVVDSQAAWPANLAEKPRDLIPVPRITKELCHDYHHCQRSWGNRQA